MLWLAFFFNQADRQIFNVVWPLIKSDLHLSDAELGLVASLFIVTIGVFIPIGGFVVFPAQKSAIVGRFAAQRFLGSGIAIHPP